MLPYGMYLAHNYTKLIFKIMTSWDKTSHMLHNIKGQKFAFYLKMSKYAHFLFSSKTKYLCTFLSLKWIFALSV